MNDKERPAWWPQELVRRPEPVPELGWCARCKRVNPRPGYPDGHEGNGWVEGLDDCAYVAGVICPDCITFEERMRFLTEDMRLFGGIFIDPKANFDE